MPALARVLQEADLRGKGPISSALDLGPYLEMIETILAEGGVGGAVTLGPEEHQRAEKGRLTRAARERGRTLVWRKAPAGELKFVLASPDGPVPGARHRRSPAERQAEQTVIDAVMTEDVADVTETAAATETTEPVAAPRRGRPRKTS